MWRFLNACLWVAVALVAAGPAQAQDRSLPERRVALVVGNAGYKTSPLLNPVNDSRDMAKALRGLGFEVIERQNLSREGFSSVIREFGDKLRGASVGLFYFAGHGLQVKGRNFLVPVDADIAREDEVQYRSFDVGEVLDKMDSARTPVNLVVLDACRNNPFARSFKTSQGGLAQMDAPTGTLIAFATAPGSVAQDGEGTANGLYTGALLKHIATPGLAVEQMFKRVRVDVVGGSKNTQVPWESSSLSRDFSFASPPAPLSTAGAAPAANPGVAFAATELALDLAFWDAVKDSRSSADYQAYLDQYPQGRFAGLARLRAAAAAPAASAPVAAPTPTPAAVQLARADAPTQAPPTAMVRWKQGSSDRSLALGGASAVSAQALSPEGLYLAAVAGGSVHWIDALRATVVRTTSAFEGGATPAGTVATDARFSPDGRWLLLRLERGAAVSHSLVDVGTGQVLWDKPSRAAHFEPREARLQLQTAQGSVQSLSLP
jgi:uncharacterized caspase-like protein